MAYSERDLEALDPLRLDREIARVAEAVRRFRRRLRRGEGTDEDPFFFTRIVAGRRAFQAVSDLSPSDPLRGPLLSWVYRLAEQRIDLGVLVRIAAERRLREHVVSEPERARLPLAGLLSKSLAEPGRRAAWLGSYLGASRELSGAVALLWERRQEIAIRMGLPGPDAIEGCGADVDAAAARFLDRTADLRASVPARALPQLVGFALGEPASNDWPRHLVPRTILDWFRTTDLFRDVELDPDTLEQPYGPASFLRALARVGAAWVDATAPRDQPFVVARDPMGLERRTMAMLLGALPANAAFARRSLGVDESKLKDHRRSMGRIVLLEARAAAFRALLRRPALAGRRALSEAFERESDRALGFPLRPDLSGAIYAPHVDDPQRFAGVLLGARRAHRLRDAHDEDWYRNPRAIEQLRDEASRSPVRTTTDEALALGSDALVQTLVEWLD